MSFKEDYLKKIDDVIAAGIDKAIDKSSSLPPNFHAVPLANKITI